MSEVERLMTEYFELKDEHRRVTIERNEFMESYQCQNMQSPGPEYPSMDCIQRWRDSIYGVFELCGTCERRHGFYTERTRLSRRRSQVLQAVRRRVRTTREQGKGKTE